MTASFPKAETSGPVTEITSNDASFDDYTNSKIMA